MNSNPLKILLFVVIASLLAPARHTVAQVSGTDFNPGREKVQFLFIHHSCGGQLLARTGSDNGASCIYLSHPNGGGLRDDLEAIGFQVNEASYGSIVGDKTDICHWNRKFRDQMDRILHTKHQDELLPEGQSNDIVAFKSCYPNNEFIAEGEEPGDPDSCELTLANAKAAYRALLPYFKEHPDVLFVAFTAPPLARKTGFRGLIDNLFHRNKASRLARKFNVWLSDEKNGWLEEYNLPNVIVFDHYDVLTKYGESDYLAYPTEGGSNSHPSSVGNREAASAFLPFIQNAWQKMRRSDG